MLYISCAHHVDFCEWSDCDFSSADSICTHSCIISLTRPQLWGN